MIFSAQKEPAIINRYILKDTNIMDSKRQYAEFIDLLRTNKNLILTGAPGTGKTFLAREIANAMGAEVEFVQFHPSYDYTDFVEGLRPTPPDRNGNIGFERKDGVFKAFCKSAICSLQLYNDRKEQQGQVIDDGYEEVYTPSFRNVYQTIVDDIQTGKLTRTMGDGYKSYRLEIRKGRIWYENRFEKEDNIEKMYNDCLARGIYNIREWKKEDYWDLVNKVTDGKTSTVDYKIYGWILQELLKRTKLHQREFVPKGHPDIISSSQQGHSENDSCVQNKKDYVFIIDEINRGEISKIFGELFFSVDPGYRGKKGLVKTQYQNMIVDKEDPFFEGFYIPENVYIIGTMNDIDRSVESMDFAMRRRFAWKEIKANENTRMLDDLGTLKSEVVEKMNCLNDKIWNENSNDGIEGLGVAYHIGGAYFRKLKLYLNEDYSNKEEAYRALWENHLCGVLFEYLRGSMNAAESMRELEKAYYAES